MKTCSGSATSTSNINVGDVYPFSCLEGYGFVVALCAPCPAGTYAIDGSTGPCTYCPAGTYSPSIGNN